MKRKLEIYKNCQQHDRQKKILFCDGTSPPNNHDCKYQFMQKAKKISKNKWPILE